MAKYDCDVIADEREKEEGLDGAVERAFERLLGEVYISIDSRSSGDSFGNVHTRIEVELLYKGKVIATSSTSI